MDPPRLLLLLGKTLQNCGGLVLAFVHKHISDSLGSEERGHGWIPLNSLHASLGACQSLKAAAEYFSWDKEAFFPTEGLLLSLFPGFSGSC